MTDTIQDFSAPAEPVPAADDPARQLTQRGRPSKVVERDLAIARVLVEGERSKHEVMAALGLEWRVTYNSLCRLRDRGLVELNRNGTRTPTWRVTAAGHAWLGTVAPAAVEEPAPEPAVEPVPEVPAAPVAQPAPPTPPEPAPVAEVPVPTSPPEEPGAQPVPISPPPPEPEPEPAPTGVAPSPGPAEPVWPI